MDGAVLYPVTEDNLTYEEVVLDNTLAVFDAEATTESTAITLGTTTVRQVTDGQGNSWVVPRFSVNYNSSTNEYALDAGESAEVNVTSESLGSAKYTFTMSDFAYLVVPSQAAVVSDGTVTISNVVRKTTGDVTTITLSGGGANNTTTGTSVHGLEFTYNATAGTISFAAPATAGAYEMSYIVAEDGLVKLGTVTFTITE